jgi:hypothetical protein
MWRIIDTVKLGFHIPLSLEQLEEWDLKVNRRYKPTRTTRFMYLSWLRFEEGSIRVKYYPQDLKGQPVPLLLFEMSLPMLVYGNNIHTISSPSMAIEKAHEIIGQYPYIPKVDLNQGILHRIDLCHNFQVGEFVPEWIRQLYKLDYPWRKTKPYYPTNGVRYHSEKASLSFYDKEELTRDSSAHGMLRMEASWKGRHQIGCLIGRQRATLGDFSSVVVATLLNAELEKLGIKDQAPLDSLATLRILMAKYGSEQAVRLFGHMHARQIASSRELKAMGISEQTIWRSKNQIKEAGLSMSITENEVALPMLVLTPRYRGVKLSTNDINDMAISKDVDICR